MTYYPEPDETPGRHYDAATKSIGAKRERERIVAMLRIAARACHEEYATSLREGLLDESNALLRAADAIERGEHEAPPEGDA